MPNITPRTNKNGEIVSYRIRVAAGYSASGEKIRPYEMTWKPAPNMTKKQIEKELNRQATLFEEQCKLGLMGDGKQKFENYADYVMKVKADSGVLRHNTEMRYRELLVRINAGIGHIKIADIRPQHLNELYRQLSQDGLRLQGAKAVVRPNVDIGALVKKAGYTNKETFCKEKLNMSYTTFNLAMKGKIIAETTADKIAKAFNVPTNELFKVQRNMKPLSPKTVKEHHRVIHAVLEMAVKENLIPYNPAARAMPPKCIAPKADYLELEQVNEIMDALEYEPLKWKTIINLLIATGARRGEIIGLRWSCVNWEFNQIHIERCVYYQPDIGIYTDIPKTEKSNRFIKLPVQVMQLLKEYKQKYYDPLISDSGSKWNRNISIPDGKGVMQTFENDFIFVSENFDNLGYPLHPDSIAQWLSSFSKRHNLPHLHPHQFRHTAASLLYFNGLDTISISGYLGHAQPSTTQNIYAHVLEEANSRIADTLGDVLFTQKLKKNAQDDKEDNKETIAG
ncbi:MAG: site-specific integrase [Ruminococcus sp.]|nr:site-specific integrase [Ruminococcus sp.]